VTIEEIALFLVQHPDWTPHYSMSIKGSYFMDGFLNSENGYVSLGTIQHYLTSQADIEDTA